jgi:hypothetical protein
MEVDPYKAGVVDSCKLKSRQRPLHVQGDAGHPG